MSEQNGFKGLEVVELNISKGEYLSEALKDKATPCCRAMPLLIR